jgi:predicted alpha/beta hydrolase family esterase
VRTVILPGYSPSNKTWAYEVKRNLKLNHEIIVHEWRHWQEENASFSVKYELEKIHGKVAGGDFNIVAKSVGTRMAMLLAPMTKTQIIKVVFCGIPTKGKNESTRKVYEEGFKNLPIKNTICFQNTSDPFAKYDQIKEFLHSINPEIVVVEKPGSTHDYPYYEDFQEFLSGAAE